MQSLKLVDLEALNTDMDAKVAAYRSASPFPYIVLDDVLDPDAFAQCVSDFPAVRDEFWKGYLHVNETKYSNTQPDTWGQTLHDVAQEFCSPEFVAWLEELTGIKGLMADWTMDGGGLHQTLRGGHLNIHADFTTHHQHDDWARQVNILLYLNEEWPEEWGGELELWDQQMRQCRAKVRPSGNRMLVFTTSFDSFHGHPDGLTCPEDMARRSMALYYFTKEESPVRRSTNYQARPDDGAGTKAAVWADKRLLDLYDRAKRRLGVSDEAAQKVMARIDRMRSKRR